MTSIWLTHAAEVCDADGPTGRYVEVVAGEVRDYGGNVLYAGTADACVRKRTRYRTPTRLVPTETRPVAGHVAGADVTWSYAGPTRGA